MLYMSLVGAFMATTDTSNLNNEPIMKHVLAHVHSALYRRSYVNESPSTRNAAL